jgi:hypothetical protein
MHTPPSPWPGWLWVLDFGGRFAVDRCGAPDTIATSLMSWMVATPVIVWFVMQGLSLTNSEIYMVLFVRGALTALTVVHVVLLAAFNVFPPVVGCGARCYPCTQVSLCSFLLAALLCYSRELRGQTLLQQNSLTYVTVAVTFSVLRIGVADAPSCLAGAISGSVLSVTFHAVFVYIRRKHPRMVQAIQVSMEQYAGIKSTNTLLVSHTECEHEEVRVDLLPPPRTGAPQYKALEPVLDYSEINTTAVTRIATGSIRGGHRSTSPTLHN